MINAKATKAGRSRTRCDRLAQMSERKRPMRQAAPVPRTPPRRSAPAASTDDIPNLELQCGHVTPRAAATPIGPPMPLPRPMPLSITSISASDLTAHLSDVSPRQTMQTMAHKQSPNPLLVRGAGTCVSTRIARGRSHCRCLSLPRRIPAHHARYVRSSLLYAFCTRIRWVGAALLLVVV